MKGLLIAAKAILIDMASTLLFLVLYDTTGSMTLSLALSIALALGQLGWEYHRGRRIDALQWISLAIVIASGAATFFSGNMLIMKLQPSLLYVVVGAAMLQKGWMNRYMPARALEVVPDLAIAFGYVWAGLMFASALLNLALAWTLDVAAWGAAMSAWAMASKLGLFLLQYALMRMVGRRRVQGATTMLTV